MIKQSIFSVLLLGFVYTFKVFDLVYVATGGGPVDASEVLSTYSYNLSFKTYYFWTGCCGSQCAVYMPVCGGADLSESDWKGRGELN